jgi:hypothetical protein
MLSSATRSPQPTGTTPEDGDTLACHPILRASVS